MAQTTHRPVEMLDGIADQQAWDAAPLKILWLLREVHDPSQTWKGEGDEGLRSTLRAWSAHLPSTSVPTWLPVAKVTYGLLHPDQQWADWAHDRSDYLGSLRSIAAVNVKKTGGGATSEWAQLEEAYAQNKDRLWDQIEDAEPDVVIGGNVLYLLRNELDWPAPTLPRARAAEPDRYASAVKDGTVWVHAHHPAHRGQHERYFIRIRKAIEEHRPLPGATR